MLRSVRAKQCSCELVGVHPTEGMSKQVHCTVGRVAAEHSWEQEMTQCQQGNYHGRGGTAGRAVLDGHSTRVATFVLAGPIGCVAGLPHSHCQSTRAAAVLLLLLFVESHASTCSSGIVAGEVAVTIDGAPRSMFVFQSGGASGGVKTSGGQVVLQHGPRVYLGDNCDAEFQAGTTRSLPLLDKTLSFDVDVSNVGCGCNVGLYFVSMPGAKMACVGVVL